MIRTGLERLLAAPERLRGRRYALLSHGASLAVAADGSLHPGHVALVRCGGPPAVLFGPEHGFYGVEQDMVPAAGARDPLTGLPVRSLYGDSVDSLVPQPEVFDDLDLLVVDLQDVGARYYTYAATAVWTAAVARETGCEVWVLDRPNPLGGAAVEGNLPAPGLDSFVGAFRLPVRHGLTLAELVLLEARRRGWDAGPGTGLEVIGMEGWRRSMRWPDTGRPWLAPSPNMPSFETALVYPGACLLEATRLSEGRGTTRPFLWTGASGLDVRGLLEDLDTLDLPGVRFLPVWFRPGFQKHRGELCGGVEWVVTDPDAFRPYRTGVELLAAIRRVSPEVFAWRDEPYEFVTDRPALDLLTGGSECREALESGRDARDRIAAWIATWRKDEETFLDERRPALLYPDDVAERAASEAPALERAAVEEEP